MGESDYRDRYGDEPQEGKEQPEPSSGPDKESIEEAMRELFRKWNLDDESAELPARSADRPIEARQVQVVNVFQETHSMFPDVGADSIFVLLKDNLGRRLRIHIEKGVAFAIAFALQGATPDRPGTHDLLKVVIERLGATLDHVIIDDLYQSIFYAKIVLSHEGKLIEIDSRSSDAIALALRFDAPIYVAESVLEAVQSD
jgi:bifunctional DNase/RNase